MYRYQCEDCGAYLDPGETCDCREKRNRDIEAVESMLTTEKDGQMVLKEAVRSGAYSWLR